MSADRPGALTASSPVAVAAGSPVAVDAKVPVAVGASSPLAVTAYLDPSVLGALASLAQHAGSLAVVAQVGLVLGDGGAVLDRLDPAALAIARSHHLPIAGVLQDIDDQGEGWRGDRVLRLGGDRNGRRRLATELLVFARAHELAGIHLDLEEVEESPRGDAALDVIVLDVATALHGAGLTLAVDLPVGVPAVRLSALARVADEVVVMAYDENDEESAPGPIASERFVAAAIADAAGAPITLGLGIYGYDWIDGQPGDPISFVDAHAAAREAGVTPAFDPESGNTRIAYSDDEGAHDIWLLDAAALWNQLARRGAVTRVALWRLGGEDPGVWEAIEAARRAEPAGRLVDRLATVAADGRVDNLGDGPFLSLSLSPEAGRRELEIDETTGTRVATERWIRSPSPWVVRRAGIMPGKVALTFDDGPDAATTPRILDALRAAHVPATFFVVGVQAARAPDLVRRAFAEGHTIGNHTFSHPDVDRVSEARLHAELESTSRLVESLLGRRPLLYRPPSLLDIEPRTPEGAAAFARAGALGYLVVDADVDPRDWQQSSASELARQTLAEAQKGGVILLHDGGGDRSATVAALPAILAGLRERGLQVVPLEELVGKRRDEVMPPAVARPVVQAAADRAVFAGARITLRWASRCLAAAVLLAIARALFLLVAALRSERRRRGTTLRGPLPSVTVVIPAFNEHAVIERTVESVLASDVPLRVVVVDDGSTDGTAERVVERFGRDRRVALLVRQNGGKADALRAGFAFARSEVVVALDGDTLFAPDTVRHLVTPLLDRRVGAVAGNAEVGNRGNVLTACQAQEYLVQQEIERRAFDLFAALPVVPGAVGAWRRRAVAEVGGFSSATLAEDADLSMALCKAGWRVVHAPLARARTEAPETMRGLVKQRVRWSFGTLQAMWKHRGALLSPRAGAFGRVVLPMLVVSQVLLPLLTPLALLGGALAIAAGNYGPALAASVVLGGLELLQLALALRLARANASPEDPSRRPTLRAELRVMLLGRLLFRPLLLLVLLRSLFRVLDGVPLGWNKLARRGTVTPFARLAA